MSAPKIPIVCQTHDELKTLGFVIYSVYAYDNKEAEKAVALSVAELQAKGYEVAVIKPSSKSQIVYVEKRYFADSARALLLRTKEQLEAKLARIETKLQALPR